MAEYFRNQRAPGRAAVHRQHLPFRAGGLRGFRVCWAARLLRLVTSRRWPTKWARCRSVLPLPATGFYDVGAGRLCACGRPDGPVRRPLPLRTLDATTVLSRKNRGNGYLSRRWIRWNCTSRILEAEVVGDEHYNVARKVQEILQRYNELQDIIAIHGHGRAG